KTPSGSTPSSSTAKSPRPRCVTCATRSDGGGRARSPAMKRSAIVDVGSNTAKLIALAYEPGRSWRQLDELRAVVRLSEGLEEGGALRAKPFAGGLAALRTFASYAQAAEVDDFVATT